jgi:glutamyl-tRNA synthetase
MTGSSVVARFAPSPTGYLHIGGARTALFNWAFARKHGGTFILRIEDTDQSRSTAESTRRIIEDLRWLGLNWDEGPEPEAADPYAHQVGGRGPYFQSQRRELYRQFVQKLMSIGRAYKCFKTPEQLAAERERAKAEKRPYKYDRTESIHLPASVVAQYEREGRPHVVRFRMPDADVTVHDLVLGEVTIKAGELEDFVILKSDGFPTFHLANVVDDALMGVTHVLRAQEHLMNTPKHVAMFDALGIPRPKYAHMPLIFNADGTKMSKRDKAKMARAVARTWVLQHGGGDEAIAALARLAGLQVGALAAFMEKKSDEASIAQALAQPAVLNLALPEIDVHDFRASGYLPEVILNYIALLGWSPGKDIERFDLEFLVRNFDIERIGKSNARFDRAKLLAFNAEAIAKLTPEEFHGRLRRHDAEFHGGRYFRTLGEVRFRMFADCYRERSRTLDEPLQNGRFFVIDDEALQIDEDAAEKNLRKNQGEGLAILQELHPGLEACGDWSAPALEAALGGLAEKRGVGLGKIAQPLRVAVAGGPVSPPIFDTLVILGKQATLARVAQALRLTAAKV